jgi:hypothetical protein
MLLLFLTVAQHESGTRKRYLGQKPNTNVKQKTYGQFNVTIRTEQVQDKKNPLTGQRRNTIILKHLMFQSCDYPHFICISFRQFDSYIYIIFETW